jgi:hypothetical protein
LGGCFVKNNSVKIRNTVKTLVFCIALLICIISAIFSSQWKNEMYTLDWKAAATVSLGFGTAIELFSLDKKI